MKKIFSFIVDKKGLVMLFILAATVFCALLIPKVKVITDMSEYLPDDSNMKVGMDIMDEQFPDASTDTTIRVMFENLSADEKTSMEERLKAIPGVDDIIYEADSEDYNKGKYTKYVIETEAEFGTDEFNAIQETLETDFSEHNMQYMHDEHEAHIPVFCLTLAVGILVLILFVFCGAWLEPVLLMFTIVLAIIINMGSNMLLGSTSQTTFAIAAILQLVLSMDYSIILINRFRQEMLVTSDRKLAMKSALTGAFSSISGSSLTTVVGLLSLVFMSFKIGQDLGFVLAKGVLCSVLCVFTFLPGLVLLCAKGLEKTAKPIPKIPTGILATIGYKGRFAMLAAFAALFAGGILLHGNTQILYTNTLDDPIADIFPTKETVVLLYDNEDEAAATSLASELEKSEYVDSAVNYSSTLGKEYTAGKLVDSLEDMTEQLDESDKGSTDLDLDESLVKLIYYDYYNKGEVSSMTVGNFINFLANDVINDETFADEMDDSIKDNVGQMKKFSNPATLTAKKNAPSMAKFFGLKKSDCEQLYLYYFTKHGGVKTSKLTLNEFTTFVLDDLANDKTYGKMFDAKSLAGIKQMAAYTDTEAMTTPMPASHMAAAMGMDEMMVMQLYAFYFQVETVTDEQVMSVQTLTNFISDNSEMFAEMMDPAMLQQVSMAAKIINSSVAGTQFSYSDLASMLAMKKADMKKLFIVYESMYGSMSDWKMSPQKFIHFLVGDVLSNKQYASKFNASSRHDLKAAKKLIDAVVSRKAYTPEGLTSLLSDFSDDLDANTVSLLYLLHDSKTNYDDSWTMTLVSLMNYLADDFINDARFTDLVDAKLKNDILDMQEQLNDGVAQLKGPSYSRMILTLMLNGDDNVIQPFYRDLNEMTSSKFNNHYYLIGDSAMSYEMSQSFDHELLLITLITALSIFLVVVLTFRSIIVSAILVLLVQTGVYVTVSAIGLQGHAINYLALLIVQCILMGATIDYGILFSTYYRESRKTMGRMDTLRNAYKGSIHTIMTSGLILVIVTGILGQCYGDSSVEEICQTISIGSFTTILLIVLILPGLLCALDRLLFRKNKKIES
ncbi:MAG: MMPL family transporter [Eubacterium sp.]|nr:MMPL family transporter [Candidatus Colimonas fimequi]